MTRRNGFTLIELVVVIMILGILAGVAAPKLFNTSGTATDNGLKQTLAIVRDGIELYSAKYGSLPTVATAADLKTALAEFMRGTFPVCPVGPTAARNSDIAIESGATAPVADAAPTKGWKYNEDLGVFICNVGTASTNNGPNYDTF
jgi:prepilin-type N-terminal cleavage/methylation domain-containing protein